MQISSSFDPIIGNTPQILILGTLPSQQSLAKLEYYGNNRNHFWRLIHDLHAQNLSVDYHDKVSFAKANKIALWDVCQHAVRRGSLDADIKEEIPNKIMDLLLEYPTINHIAFNGQKAEKLFDKHFKRQKNIAYSTLLSSSPANAMYSYEEKLSQWKDCFGNKINVIL